MIEIYYQTGLKKKSSEDFMKLCLGHFLNENPKKIKINKHSTGQPYINYSKKISFSLSHSEDHFTLACSKKFDVGIDTQKHRPFNPQIFNRICTSQELATMQAQTEETFFNIWTIKEACLKCIGMGLAYPMDQLDINFALNEVRVLTPSSRFNFQFSGSHQVFQFRSLDLFPPSTQSTSHLVWSTHPSESPKITLINCKSL